MILIETHRLTGCFWMNISAMDEVHGGDAQIIVDAVLAAAAREGSEFTLVRFNFPFINRGAAEKIADAFAEWMGSNRTFEINYASLTVEEEMIRAFSRYYDRPILRRAPAVEPKGDQQ